MNEEKDNKPEDFTIPQLVEMLEVVLSEKASSNRRRDSCTKKETRRIREWR